MSNPKEKTKTFKEHGKKLSEIDKLISKFKEMGIDVEGASECLEYVTDNSSSGNFADDAIHKLASAASEFTFSANSRIVAALLLLKISDLNTRSLSVKVKRLEEDLEKAVNSSFARLIEEKVNSESRNHPWISGGNNESK